MANPARKANGRRGPQVSQMFIHGEPPKRPLPVLEALLETMVAKQVASENLLKDILANMVTKAEFREAMTVTEGIATGLQTVMTRLEESKSQDAELLSAIKLLVKRS